MAVTVTDAVVAGLVALGIVLSATLYTHGEVGKHEFKSFFEFNPSTGKEQLITHCVPFNLKYTYKHHSIRHSKNKAPAELAGAICGPSSLSDARLQDIVNHVQGH